MRRLRWLIVLMPLVPTAPFAAAQFSCSVSATTMNFGTYTGSLSIPGPTPVTVTCPFFSSYNVALNAGLGAGATTTTRKMTGPGSATLSYQMFQNSSLTTNWGNTVGTDTVAGIGFIGAQNYNIYPRASLGQIRPKWSHLSGFRLQPIEPDAPPCLFLSGSE